MDLGEFLERLLEFCETFPDYLKTPVKTNNIKSNQNKGLKEKEILDKITSFLKRKW